MQTNNEAVLPDTWDHLVQPSKNVHGFIVKITKMLYKCHWFLSVPELASNMMLSLRF